MSEDDNRWSVYKDDGEWKAHCYAKDGTAYFLTWREAYDAALLWARRDISQKPCYCVVPTFMCLPCSVWANFFAAQWAADEVGVKPAARLKSKAPLFSVGPMALPRGTLANASRSTR